MKILSIFDFDDTLIKMPNARVKVKHGNGNITHLSSEEYNTYQHNHDDHFDYTDFNVYPDGAIPITNTFLALDKSIDRGDDVIILTARSSHIPVRDYVTNLGYNVHVAAVGHPSAHNKAMFVIDMLKNSSYDYVQVFEDNASNIRAIKKVVDDRGIYFRSIRVLAGSLYPNEDVDMKKNYPPGAGTVVFRFFSDERRGPNILLLQNFDNTWDLPKGRIDVGESPFECSKRETKEETSITELYYRWGSDPILIPNIHFYVAETTQDPSVVPNPKHGYLEHVKAVWVPPEEAYFFLPNYLKPVIKEALSRLMCPSTGL